MRSLFFYALLATLTEPSIGDSVHPYRWFDDLRMLTESKFFPQVYSTIALLRKQSEINGMSQSPTILQNILHAWHIFSFQVAQKARMRGFKLEDLLHH